MTQTKFMKKKLLFSLTLISHFIYLTLSGQDLNNQESDKKYNHEIGAGAGFTTGYGLSYRYMPTKYGFQINFAPYHDKEIHRYSVGLTFTYTIIENKMSRLFLYQGNHFYYNSQLVYVSDPDPTKPYNPGSKKERISDRYVNNGVGFGIELIIVKRIGFNLMAGYASYRNFEELNLTGETALYYKF